MLQTSFPSHTNLRIGWDVKKSISHPCASRGCKIASHQSFFSIKMTTAQHSSMATAVAEADQSYSTTARHSSMARAVAEKGQSYSTTARHSSTARAVVEAHQSYGTKAQHSSMARAVAEVD